MRAVDAKLRKTLPATSAQIRPLPSQNPDWIAGLPFPLLVKICAGHWYHQTQFSLPLGCRASLLDTDDPRNGTGTPMNHFPARELSRRLLSPMVAGSFCPAARDCPGFIQGISSGGQSFALQNIHSLGRGEGACATLAVALGIIALGTGHRRREPFLQLRLRLLHGSRRRLVTKVCAD